MKEIKSAEEILNKVIDESGFDYDTAQIAMKRYASQFIDKAAEVAEDKKWVVSSSPPQQVGGNSKIVKEILSLKNLLQ